MTCLDLSPESVTALEVRDGVVTAWGSLPLADDLDEGGLPGLVALTDALQELLATTGISARRARLTLPDGATVTRTLLLPPMPTRDLARAMRYQAERHLPFPVEQARWSWDVLEQRLDAVLVYLVATWRDVADRCAEAARLAGLRPEVLEPRSLAVARALDREQATLLEGVGRALHLMVLEHRRPALVERATCPPERRSEALERLLHRAFRHQSSAGRLPPVFLAGDLESGEVPTPVPALPVGRVLNGLLPAAPPGFRPGAYLAGLGLAMRSRR